ncbi:N-terminal EF-hand calcium-binding protein 3 isoform X2 [Erinaceus europaeus]|uniref:N-terminal EF-hand calcium-binding protein 3 isoform X2 n=1 Tax=Erinaceus europaeus TaxID=9365 RepID=A0ABM3X700_ERIEU|nr:N-terminal EF-hand calcium-binding protein 3 isoform X2 [Erinaceus europaeus]
MACAGLLTVCLLRPPAPERPRPPAPPPSAGPAGHALFQDVFHRADKNDDGKLSFEEFQNYFADGVLSPAELRELFSSIDGHPTDNLETEKLCDYFSEHLGVYQPVLAALESLNRAVLTAMDTTKLEYEQATKVDQFVTRFLLRETASQLQALQSSLEGASETLEAQARKPGPPGWSPCMKRSLPRGPTHTSLWPSGRYRWQRRPCKTSTVPCAAMWTSHGLRANACMCPPRSWTAPPSCCMSSGRTRPLGDGTSNPPAARPSSASSLITCELRTPLPLCSSQPLGGS